MLGPLSFLDDPIVTPKSKKNYMLHIFNKKKLGQKT